MALSSFDSTLVGRMAPYVGSGLLHGVVLTSVAARTAPAHMEASVSDPVYAIDAVDEPVSPEVVAQDVSVSPRDPARARELAARRGHRHPYPVPASHDAQPHDPAVDHHARTSDASDDRESRPPANVDVASVPLAPHARFTIRVAPSFTTAASGSGGASETAATLPEAAVSVPARLIASVQGSYPAEARANEIEANVSLEIVVDTHGAVVEARPLSRTGFGFDEAAVAAIRRYRFSPAQKDGHPARVRMRWSVEFRLR